MNLLDEPWLPVRMHDGRQQWISPHQLSDPGVAAFDACRADFNGALAQFAVGLLQTCTPIASDGEWRALLNTSPDAATLADWLEPHRSAFEFYGDGARFMQDFELRTTDTEPNGIGSLLIDSPSANALEKNKDHFTKRGRVERMCPHCAAIALFTLQTNAPEGGQGHLTSLRGGGPLTTLLVASSGNDYQPSLWTSLWLNVQNQVRFLSDGVSAEKLLPVHRFPWLAAQSDLQKEQSATTPLQVHPAHVFWAMPRRIRLELTARRAGACDLCSRESEQLVSQYVTVPHGLDYKGGWVHPLSPYYQAKEGLQPIHPQPDGLGYRHWLAWVLGTESDKNRVQSAAVVTNFRQQSRIEKKTGIALRIWAFGYDTKSAKVRCWYESTMPLYHLDDCGMTEQIALREEVGSWLDGAELAVSCLNAAVRAAWFNKPTKARGDFSYIDAAFWSRTEHGFYGLLRDRIRDLRDGNTGDALANAEAWRLQLRKAALHLFDAELVGAGPIERQKPARIAAAHRQLDKSLNGPKLRQVLGLPQPVKAASPAA